MRERPFSCLRPYLYKDFKPIVKATAAHARFFSAVARRRSTTTTPPTVPISNDVKHRVKELTDGGPLDSYYPRSENGRSWMTNAGFRNKFSGLKNDELDTSQLRTLKGRVDTVRIAGSKLVFFHFDDGRATVQAVVNLRDVQDKGVVASDFSKFYRLMRRGDWYAVIGHPHRTSAGELSIRATELPVMLAPSLHQLPEDVADTEMLSRHRHVDLMLNRNRRDVLLLRHYLEKDIRTFLENNRFISVRTPLLSANTGGAIARQFETRATEFGDQKLSLRIAPELFLKRLVIGNVGKVYEMGPAFRNEGLDGTHNPEFTICEFYWPYASLADLMSFTREMLQQVSLRMQKLKERARLDLYETKVDFARVIPQLEFIPAIEACLGEHLGDENNKLPDLTASDAVDKLVKLFSDLNIELPSSRTLPRLLDALCARYVEPKCIRPTWITHHPECLSPLAKSFTCPSTGQRIAARGELFINGREYVNCYEEENSPFEQERKFTEQLKYRDAENHVDIDRSYLEALEWGLPPTGGWGCGIDRLCMLFAGTDRIADVLTFGNLRNVVALGAKATGQGCTKEEEE